VAELKGDLRDRHIGELVKQLGADVSTLIRQEIELGKAELAERVDQANRELQLGIADAKATIAADTRRARHELAEHGKAAGAAAGIWGVAGVVGLGAFGALSAFLVLALDGALANWLAALVVALAYGVVAAVFYGRGRRRLREAKPLLSPETVRTIGRDLRDTVARTTAGAKRTLPPVPNQTIETLKEDVEWVKHPTRSVDR
jgi:hypothetical protein